MDDHANSDEHSAEDLDRLEEERRFEAHRRKIAHLRPWRPGESGNPEGAKRRKGKKIRRTQILEAARDAEGSGDETSLQYMRRIMNDPNVAVSRRDEMAKALGRIEADILLRMEERARNSGPGFYDDCQSTAELAARLDHDVGGGLGPADRCGVEMEAALMIIIGFANGEQDICREMAGVVERLGLGDHERQTRRRLTPPLRAAKE